MIYSVSVAFKTYTRLYTVVGRHVWRVSSFSVGRTNRSELKELNKTSHMAL